MGSWESTDSPAGWAGINGIPEALHVPGTVLVVEEARFWGKVGKGGQPC